MPGNPTGSGTYSQLCAPSCGWPLIRMQVYDSEPSPLSVGTPSISSSAWKGHTCREMAIITAFLVTEPVWKGADVEYRYRPYRHASAEGTRTHLPLTERVTRPCWRAAAT